MLIKRQVRNTEQEKINADSIVSLIFFLIYYGFSIHVLREETVIPLHLSAPLQIICIYLEHQSIAWFPGYSFAKHFEGSWMWKLLYEAKYYSAFKWLIKMPPLKAFVCIQKFGCVYTYPLNRDIFMRHFKRWTGFEFI